MQAKDRQLVEQQCGARCIATDFQALSKNQSLPGLHILYTLIVEIYSVFLVAKSSGYLFHRVDCKTIIGTNLKHFGISIIFYNNWFPLLFQQRLIGNEIKYA